MSVVLIDAFDSFVYIIEQYLAEIDDERTVIRSDSSNIEEIEKLNPQVLVLGPGPGNPDESGHVELVRHFAGKIPILGVCLGHQAIGRAFGTDVTSAKNIMHGKTSVIEHDHKGVFSLEPGDEKVVTRYHSLIIDPETLSEDLYVSAYSLDDNYVMGIRHKSLPIEGVQFHPESISTEDGLRVFSSFYKTYV